MVTVITKTIGSGKDYASFTLAEADVTNIGTSADLVANDEAIVFEADAGTYSENVTFQSTLTTDATRNVTYKPAAGSEHGGVPGQGVHLTSSGITTAIRDDYTRLIGLSAYSSGSTVFWQPAGVGSLREDCIGHVGGTSQTCFYSQGGTASAPHVFRNCVAYTEGSQQAWFLGAVGSDGYAEAYNCTSMSQWMTVYASAATMNAKLVNCMAYGIAFRTQESSGGVAVVTGSNNFGGATNPFPVGIQGSPYPVTATTSFSTPLGSGDYAVYMGATGALADVTGNDVWQQGVGPSVNSDVPTTDINGVARSGATCNPGAFEADGFVAPTVLTRTIKPVGGDYASFTLAEADVTNIGGSADLTLENEAIVFEADAGTYNESGTVTILSTLVTDATRNVTYKPAAGAEHGGSESSGVIVQRTSGATPFDVRDNFTVIDGLVIKAPSAGGSGLSTGAATAEGFIFRNCIVVSGGYTLTLYGGGTATNPIQIENFAGRCTTSTFAVRALGLNRALYVEFTNCTIRDGLYSIQAQPTNYDATVGLVNVLALNASTGTYLASSGTGTLTVSGSNNFGGSSSPFPFAIQGSPYPITATTDLDPGPGDWAIYDAATGALIDDPDNDVLAGGIGPDANPDVPTTDIIGNPRTGLTTEPGAFVLPPPPVVEEDTWTPVMVRRNDPVDVYGVLTFGDAYINAVEDTLSVTGADGTDATPAIPVGTRALWIQLVSQTGAAAGETCDVSIEVSASQSLTLATLNGAGTAVGNVPGLMQFPVDCLGQNDPDTPVYPRVKMVTGSTVGASDVVKIRVVAICGQQTNTTWS